MPGSENQNRGPTYTLMDSDFDTEPTTRWKSRHYMYSGCMLACIAITAVLATFGATHGFHRRSAVSTTTTTVSTTTTTTTVSMWADFDTTCTQYAVYNNNKSLCCWTFLEFDTDNAPLFVSNGTLMQQFLESSQISIDTVVQNDGALLGAADRGNGDPTSPQKYITSMTLWESADKYVGDWIANIHAPVQCAWFYKYAAPLGVRVGLHTKLVECAAVVQAVPDIADKRVNDTGYAQAVAAIMAMPNLYTAAAGLDGLQHRVPPGHAFLITPN